MSGTGGAPNKASKPPDFHCHPANTQSPAVASSIKKVAAVERMIAFPKKLAKAGKKLKVTGDLTMKGVAKEVTLELTLMHEVINPFSKQPARGGVATGSLNRLDWGLTWNMPMANNGLLVGKDVKIEVVAELTPKAPAAAADKK